MHSADNVDQKDRFLPTINAKNNVFRIILQI